MKNLCALRLKTFVLVTLLVFMTGAAAQGETVRGLIRADSEGGGKLLIIKGQSEPLRIIPANSSAGMDLRRLKEGDLIVGQGVFNSDDSFTLEAVESVGLQELLGRWHTVDWKIFEFRDFHRLVMYNAGQRAPLTTLSLTYVREYTYFLAPENGSRFSIFLSDDKNVHAGTLEFTDGKVNIEVLSNRTLGVAENISLSPVSLQ